MQKALEISACGGTKRSEIIDYELAVIVVIKGAMVEVFCLGLRRERQIRSQSQMRSFSLDQTFFPEVANQGIVARCLAFLDLVEGEYFDKSKFIVRMQQ